MHLTAADGQCVAACPACAEFRGDYRLLEAAYAGANRIIRDLKEEIWQLQSVLDIATPKIEGMNAELDEANAIAAQQEKEIAEHARLLSEWQAAEKVWIESLRKLQNENAQLRAGNVNPLFQWSAPPWG